MIVLQLLKTEIFLINLKLNKNGGNNVNDHAMGSMFGTSHDSKILLIKIVQRKQLFIAHFVMKKISSLNLVKWKSVNVPIAESKSKSVKLK